MYLVFQNEGEIHEDSITTFGVNAKENDNPIGYFGTGLKYAIAVVLRMGGTISIFKGEKELKFSTKKKIIRGKEFDLVYMNRTKLGFTLELGKNWEAWQAFRELYCNALDENGTVGLHPKAQPYRGTTTIAITGETFIDQYYNKHKIVLESKPIFATTFGEIHLGESQHIYYRGISVYTLEKPSSVTYNILSKQELTEDRTAKNYWDITVLMRRLLLQCTDFNVILKVLTSKDRFEFDAYYNCLSSCEYASEEFMQVCRTLVPDVNTLSNPTLKQFLLEREPLPTIYEESKLNGIQHRSLTSSVNFLAELGYPVDKYPILVVKTLGQDILGKAEDGKIYLAEAAFRMGTKMVCGTLFEEFIHLEHKLLDCDRRMQNFLIDTIMSVGELALDKGL
jgi:hypothetical protein